MRRVLCALLVLVGLVAPATVHAAPAPTYASLDSATDLARSYFGARYYAGGNGRFTSPDPAPGVLENPQTWNRYAYVLNNPLRYIDPMGLYEWSVECSDQACEDNRQKFRDAYAQVRGTFEQTKQGSEEYRVLKSIIDKIGTEGDGNKVRVAFSATQEDFGYTVPTGTGGRLMTFNFAAVETSLTSGQVRS